MFVCMLFMIVLVIKIAVGVAVLGGEQHHFLGMPLFVRVPISM